MTSAPFTPRTPMLVNMAKRASDADLDNLAECHQHYVAQFAQVQADHGADPGIALGMHEATDHVMRNLAEQDPKRARRVACRKGCAHCCHLSVDITEPEARMLVHVARDEGIPIDRAHLERQRDAPDFFALPLAQRRCVFLRPDRSCAVYEHRPVNCRKYLVVDSPKKCDTVKFPGARVLNFVSAEAECLQSAALHIFRAGHMPAMLLELL
jgi:Fe-S-cluster containining protein